MNKQGKLIGNAVAKLSDKLTRRLKNVKTVLFQLLGAHKNTTKYLATTFCEETLPGNS